MTRSVTICFALQKNTGGSFEHASIMMGSIKKHMPYARVVQLSNLDFPQIPGTDEIIRHENKGDFIEWGFGAFNKLLERGGNVLQIATDVVLNDDVGNVFDLDFDAAACPYPYHTRTDGTCCGDVNFVKPEGKVIWREVLDYYLRTEEIRDGWEGGQTAFKAVTAHEFHRMLFLPHDKYCYTPSSPKLDCTKAKMVHFRGTRKAFMAEVARKQLGIDPYTAL